MQKFSVGQRIIVTGSDEDTGNEIYGKKGRIVDIVQKGLNICIEMDEKPPFGHDGGKGQGRDGYCWWIDSKYIAVDVHDNEDAIGSLPTIDEFI